MIFNFYHLQQKKGTIMYIYVASSWCNNYHNAFIYHLQKLKFDVYDFRAPAPGEYGFTWDAAVNTDSKLKGVPLFLETLCQPLSEKGFKLDFSAMMRAHICILLLPCGRSAHLEAGWMKGNGRKLIVYFPSKKMEEFEPELMYKMADYLTCDFDKVIYILNEERNKIS
jgi:hypothetical protein